MLVIVIIGVVYTLAISKLQSVKEGEVSPTLLNLKEYLLSQLDEDAKSVKILCLDECQECDIYLDDTKVKTIESFFDATIERYRYDLLQGAIKLKESSYFNEDDVQESVCFSFEVDKNGVSEQIMVLYKERVYDYTPYFDKTQEYDSLSEAVDAKERLREEVMQ